MSDTQNTSFSSCVSSGGKPTGNNKVQKMHLSKNLISEGSCPSTQLDDKNTYLAKNIILAKFWTLMSNIYYKNNKCGQFGIQSCEWIRCVFNI